MVAGNHCRVCNFLRCDSICYFNALNVILSMFQVDDETRRRWLVILSTYACILPCIYLLRLVTLSPPTTTSDWCEHKWFCIEIRCQDAARITRCSERYISNRGYLNSCPSVAVSNYFKYSNSGHRDSSRRYPVV